MKSLLNTMVSDAIKDAHILNAELCRAVEKHQSLYDQNHSLYKKRLVKEASWESVARECQDSVAGCKRRWRQIREEFTRCFNEPVKRNRTLKLKNFYLTDALKFLVPFMSSSPEQQQLSENDTSFNSTVEEEHLDESMAEENREEIKMNESFLDEEYGFNETQEIAKEPVNENEGAQQTQQQQQNRQQELPESEDTEDVNRPRQDHVEERPTFYIKQTSNDSCTLTISKVIDPLDTADGTPKQSTYDEDDLPLRDLSSTSSGRSLRGRPKAKKNLENKQEKDLHAIQDIAIMKPGARVTRQQNRRKSVAVSSASVLGRDISLSPQTPKMSPKARQTANRLSLLKTEDSELVSPTRQRQQQQHQLKQQQLNQQLKQQKEQQKLQEEQELLKQQQEKEEKKQQETEHLKQKHKQQEQLIKKQQDQLKQQKEQLKKHQQRQLLVQQQLKQNQQQQQLQQQQQQALIQQALQQQQQPQQQQTQQQQTQQQKTQQQKNQQQQQKEQQQLKIVEDEFVATPPIAHSSIIMSEDSLGIEPQVKRLKQNITTNTPVFLARENSAPLVLNPLVLDTPTTAPVKQLPPVGQSVKFFLHRGTQCSPEQNEYTDDGFLSALQPPMREMNPRQKMHFKKKVFQALMEVFDDATDFPDAGEVQHFNINTPSGFESTTTQELRLLRELVSLVTAAKRTPEVQKLTNCTQNHQRSTTVNSNSSDRSNASSVDTVSTTTANTTTTTSKAPVVHQSRDELGLPRNIIQRVIKMSDTRVENNSTNLAGSIADKRCHYRIFPNPNLNIKAIPNSSPNQNTNSPVVTNANRQSSFTVPQLNLISLSPPTKAINSSNGNEPSNSQAAQRTATNSGATESNSAATNQPNARPVNQTLPTFPRTKAIQIDSNAAKSSGAVAARRMARRYSVCSIPQNVSSAVGKTSADTNPLALPIQFSNSRMIGSSANPNPSLKRRVGPAIANALSHARSRYPTCNTTIKTVPVSKLTLSNNKEKIPTISSVASTSSSFNTEFVVPANAMPRKTQIDQAARAAFPKSPSLKRSYVVRGTMQSASGQKLPERSRSSLLNNESMETAGTIAADDFTTLRIKQEEDALLGL